MMVRDHIRRDGLFVDRRETDINTRMPREEASEIFGVIKSIGKRSHWAVAEFPSDVTCLALALDPKLFIEIMGSYRRSVIHDCAWWT
jgi:hypothetical protein